MPLVGTGPALGDAIKAAIDGVGDKSNRNAVFEAMGTAIIAHFLAHGTNITVIVASVTGVTPGGGASGSGTGTGTLT